MNIVEIYSDGACKGNPGIGGWGVVLLYKQHEKHLYGLEYNTTNNRMELLAVIMGLRALKKTCQVKLYTDSKYVQLGMLNWLENWKKNQWRNSQKKEIKNLDLWQMLDIESQKHCIEWIWVKGHAGNKFNEKADELANLAISSNINLV